MDEKELIDKIRKLSEDLAAERNKLDMVLQSIVDGVYITNLDREITFWNRGAERITGFKAGDVTGKLCRNLLSHTDDSGNSLCDIACPLSATMATKDPIYGKDVHSGSAWGRTIPVSVSCSPMLDSNGNIVGAIEVFRDISEQKELERQKANFYSMVSHDLKSPLTLIMGYSELLLDMEIDEGSKEKSREFAEAINKSGKYLFSMIDDFMSISRIESGAIPLKPKPHNIGELLARLADAFRPVAEKKGIRIEHAESDGLPTMEYDRKLMDRALSNLITNALKFTPDGGTVTLRTEYEGDPSGYVKILVTDTGPGIPEEDQGRVFDWHYRTKGSAGIEGTGLGLAIVKTFVEAHGGTVGVSSVYSNGSTFIMRLPLVPPSALEKR